MGDLNLTTGALLGYSSENSSMSLKHPGGVDDIRVQCTPPTTQCSFHHQLRHHLPPSQTVSSGPKITAFQSLMLSGLGEPLTPCGGSCCRRRKSRISLCCLLVVHVVVTHSYILGAPTHTTPFVQVSTLLLRWLWNRANYCNTFHTSNAEGVAWREYFCGWLYTTYAYV